MENRGRRNLAVVHYRFYELYFEIIFLSIKSNALEFSMRIPTDGRELVVALFSTGRLARSAQKFFLLVIENLLTDSQRWQESKKEEQSTPSVSKRS